MITSVLRATGAAAQRRPRMLILGFSFRIQYHTMRCANDAGYDVYVLGQNLARGLRVSRYCAGYRSLAFAPEASTLDSAVADIRAAVARWSIDVVAPSDVVSTKLLILIGARLPVRVLPLPDLECFEMLRDKWSFYQFCLDNDLPTPPTWLFASKHALRSAIMAGNVPLPIVLKPTDGMAGAGVMIFRSLAELESLDDIDYRPILAQRFVAGRDGGLAMVCQRGRVTAMAFQRHGGGGYQYGHGDAVTALAHRIADASRFHGIVHFDVVEAVDTGDVTLIECNPRVWYSMFALTVAGINFLRVALAPDGAGPMDALVSGDEVIHVHKALVRRLRSPRSLSKGDWRMLKYHARDPLPALLEWSHYFDESRASGDFGKAGSLGHQINALTAMDRLPGDAVKNNSTRIDRGAAVGVARNTAKIESEARVSSAITRAVSRLGGHFQ